MKRKIFYCLILTSSIILSGSSLTKQIIDDNETVNEIKYASNKDFEELIKTSYEDYQIINNIRLDLEKIYIYAANIKPTPAHAVKARYVKGIEALNGK